MRTRTITVGDVELAIAEAGPGGRPLLLLHGFTGAKEDFTDWLDRLAEDGWHAVAPDHRGHGASSKPAADAAYSVSLFAGDALALADSLGWQRFALLGHSMGGFVAQQMALVATGRIDALVLMDTGHGPVEGLDPAELELAVAIVRESGVDGLADVMADREGPLETPAHRRLLAERDGYADFEDRKFRATSPHVIAAMLPAMQDQEDRLEALAGLPPSLPALVIVGDQDAPFIGPSKRMADAIPGASLAVIAHAGHSPQFENPEGWWHALSAFLAHVAA